MIVRYLALTNGLSPDRDLQIGPYAKLVLHEAAEDLLEKHHTPVSGLPDQGERPYCGEDQRSVPGDMRCEPDHRGWGREHVPRALRDEQKHGSF